MVKQQKSNAENVMESAAKALESINSRYSTTSTVNARDEDRDFVEMLYTMLHEIPDDMSKAMLRIEIQTKVIQLRYSAVTPPTGASTPTVAPNPFGHQVHFNQFGSRDTMSSPPMFRPF